MRECFKESPTRSVVFPVAKDCCLKCGIYFTLDPLKFSGIDEANLDGAHRGLSMEQLNQEVER